MRPKLTYCLVVLNRLEELQIACRRVCPWVDRTCIVDGGSTDGTIEWLNSQEAKNLKITFKVSKQYRYAIGNHTPKERNQYLEMAGSDGWLLYSDSDEFIDEDACRNFYNLIEQAERTGHDGICFKAHDIWTYEDGAVYDNVSNYWNPMMWKGYRSQIYTGHTHSSIHRPGARNRWMQSGYEYQHVKTERRLWINSTYLYWTTAQVAQNVTNDPTWVGFHNIMQKYGHVDWHEFNKHMTKGNLPKEITDWFIAHRDAENPEEASWFIWYFVFLHPEENIDKLSSTKYDRYTWDYVEQARQKARIKRQGLLNG